MDQHKEWKPESGIRRKIYEIIFEADTKPGKDFDVFLLITIVFSVTIVIFESVESFDRKHRDLFYILEWVITIIFTLEYLVRIYCCEKPRKYIFSFYGLIDLLSLLPTYLSLFITGTHYLVVVRIIRLLRVFRILRMTRYIGESQVLLNALKASQPKITVFLGFVLTLVVIIGAVMYMIEGPANGFHSIPRSMYWAVVTLTTVGYGDVVPQTVIGQTLASLVMIAGYGIIAVPTGIVSVELSKAVEEEEIKSCNYCKIEERDIEAKFCRRCSEPLA